LLERSLFLRKCDGLRVVTDMDEFEPAPGLN
jgi:hypothetical protein